MKRSLNLLLIFAALFTFDAFAQDSKLSLELNYPKPVGNNFMEKFHTGIIDMGAKYRIFNVQEVKLGVSVNSSLYYVAVGSRDEGSRGIFLPIQPRVFAELDLLPNNKLHPSVGLGYYLLYGIGKSYYNGQTFSEVSINTGLNLNAGVSYDFNEIWFMQAQYDFMKFVDEYDDMVFRTHIHILKFGIGLRL